MGGSANIETFGTRDLDPAAVAASAKERTADFIKFLRQHFTKVTAVDGKNYSPGMSAAVDVTIFDGMPPVVKERVMERDAEGMLPAMKKRNICLPTSNTLLCASLRTANSSAMP